MATYSAASLGLTAGRGRTCYGPSGNAFGCGIDLAIGPDGNLYVTDGSNDTVTVVSPTGKFLRRWGEPGKGPGEFSFVTKDLIDPSDVDAKLAVGPDGKVYVTDSGNARVEVFTPAGRFVRQVGSFGVNDGQFQMPYTLAVDRANGLYVVDEQLNTVSKFSPAGKFVWQIGGDADRDPELRGEFDLAMVDAHGRIVTTSDAQQAIVYIDGSGHKVDSFHTDFGIPRLGPCNVTVDGAGYTFVTSCGVVGQSHPLTASGCGGTNGTPCPYRPVLVYDRAHHLEGAWPESHFAVAPRFGPNGEIFTVADDGSILKLKVSLPDA